MADPITNEDLYGKTDEPAKSQPARNASQSVAGGPLEPLHYEETPIIEPIHDVQPPPSVPKRSSGIVGILGTVLFFILLFALGVWLSTVVRRYLPTGLPTVAEPTLEQEIEQLQDVVEISPVPVDPFVTWVSYQVLSGVTKQPIAGTSFKLPPEVTAPICDGANCASQGTYLPGGTRFTVAARGGGQLLSDFRGSQLVDVGGRPFTMRETTIAGKKAIEFTGLFTGTTAGGYAFNQMRGVMIEVDDTLSLEINHFTPGGVNADFSGDDNLFNRILESLSINSAPTP